MIILRQHEYTKKKEKPKVVYVQQPQQKNPTDSRILTGAGKVALGTAGALGAGAAYNLGKTGVNLVRAGRDAKNIYKIATNEAGGMKGIADLGQRTINTALKSKGVPSPIANQVTNEARKLGEAAWKYKPNFSKIDRLSRWSGYLNDLSGKSRTFLNNAERYTQLAAETVKDANKGAITEGQKKVINKVPVLVRHLAKSATGLKNAKLLGGGALVAGNIGLISYVNGRSLQNQTAPPTTNLRHL